MDFYFKINLIFSNKIFIFFHRSIFYVLNPIILTLETFLNLTNTFKDLWKIITNP